MSQPPEWSSPDVSGGHQVARPDTPGPADQQHPPQQPAQQPAQQSPGPVSPNPGAVSDQPGGWTQQAWGHQPAWGHPEAADADAGAAGQPGWGRPPGTWQAHRPKPGIIPLRPITLGEIYDGAFQAIRTNPRTMIGISAVVIAATALLTTVPQAAALVSFGDSDLFDPEAAAELTAADVAASFGGLMSTFLLPALIQALAVTVVTGLLIIAVSNAVIGRRTTPAQLWARTRGRVLALIVLSIVLMLAAFAVGAALIAPGILVLALTDQTVVGVLLTVLGVVLAIAAYVVLYYGLWSLAAPALLLENLSVVASLRRSGGLVRRSFWRVVGIMLLTTLLVGMLSGLISVPFSVIGMAFTLGQDTPYDSFTLTLLQLLVSQVGSILSGAVLYPLTAAVTALLYIDLRMRQEGLDVDLMRAAEEPGG